MALIYDWSQEPSCISEVIIQVINNNIEVKCGREPLDFKEIHDT